MEEKEFLVISIVRDLMDNTLLVVREKHQGCRPMQDAFPSDTKQIGENATQAAIRIAYEASGITPQNPVEVAKVKVQMLHEKSYVVLVFLSTQFTGTLHPATGTDIVWQRESDVTLGNSIAAYVLRHILANKYVTGTYSYADGEFSLGELRDL